jgi:hypothetical protein
MDETPSRDHQLLAFWARHIRGILALCAVISVACSIFVSINQTSALAYDASRFCFAAVTFSWLLMDTALAVYVSFGPGRLHCTAPARLYSVPRRFGLGTLLVVTMAFGALATLFRWLLGEPVVILLALAFIAVVGFFQFILDRAPRQASAIAGVIFFSLPAGVAALAANNFLRIVPLSNFAFYAACWTATGAILGYCAGVIVGVVFMLIAAVRRMAHR